MTEFHLRDYQQACIDAVFKAWEGGMRRPAVVLPTGAGKTVVFAHLIKQFRSHLGSDVRMPWRQRVMVLVHRDELADQAMAKIKAIAPELSVGKVKAADNEITADVMVCSVQTLANAKRRRQIRNEAVVTRSGAIGLIITDECHHGAARTYKTIYSEFPDALNLGVTATLQRGDGVGLGSTWDDVVYTRSVLWMISKGYLSDVRMKNVKVTNLALDGVKRSAGDFQVGDLGRALEESDMADRLPAAYREHAGQRPGVVFTPTVATAEAVAQSFNGAGIRTAVITGETPRGDRQRIFEDYRTGQVQVLANCMVLTEGFDAPWAEVAVIARPTQSQPLYTQMVGRVLRRYPGKENALVLNVAGPGHKLCSLVDLEPGAVAEMDDGELLSEAVEREQREHSERKELAGLSFTEVDAFAASKAAWLKTPAGNLFISCGKSTVFLWPSDQPGLYDVCFYQRYQKAQRTEHTGLDLGSAMAWGEAVAEDFSEFSVKRSARWRSGPPSEAQQGVADRFGIQHQGMTKGQLSDAISIAFAAQVLG